MENNNEYIKNYDEVFEDIKFVANSIIRLKVLKALYEKPKNMKELTSTTKLNYSSISGILHGLELKNMIYRKSNKYYLVNFLKLQMKNILEMTSIVNLLEDIFNIIEGHVIDNIPEQSINELYLLSEVKLLESDGVDVDKIINFIDDTLSHADCVRGIFPIYHESFNFRLNELILDDKLVEIKVSKSVFDVYENKSNVKNLSSFKGKNNFLLIITNEMMIFGLFRNDGIFDQNRLLISRSENALKWGNNLFKYFKKKNK